MAAGGRAEVFDRVDVRDVHAPRCDAAGHGEECTGPRGFGRAGESGRQPCAVWDLLRRRQRTVGRRAVGAILLRVHHEDSDLVAVNLLQRHDRARAERERRGVVLA
eukprot:3303941-Prymnesium_polylepis.1